MVRQSQFPVQINSGWPDGILILSDQIANAPDSAAGQSRQQVDFCSRW
jgi:hypothetical protein